MRSTHTKVSTQDEADHLNRIANEAERGLSDLRDAIGRLQEIERRWNEGMVPDSVSLNNAAGRVSDAAWGLGSALAIVRTRQDVENELLLEAVARRANRATDLVNAIRAELRTFGKVDVDALDWSHAGTLGGAVTQLEHALEAVKGLSGEPTPPEGYTADELDRENLDRMFGE